MEELIFFAVLIFFSIVESIARSRKQRKGGGPLPEIPGEVPESEVERSGQARTRRPAPAPRPRMRDVQSYDDDPSFDARASTEEARASAEASFDEAASSEEERRRRSASSESMIPADIWEEIAGLAREARVELPKPQPRLPKTQLPQPPRVPRPKPRTPAPKPPLRPRSTTPQPRRPTAPERQAGSEGTGRHPVHLSHVGYGTDPSERTPSAQDALPPQPRASAADAMAVRMQLRGRGAGALRQALILSEVLGPPASSKPDRFSE